MMCIFAVKEDKWLNVLTAVVCGVLMLFLSHLYMELPYPYHIVFVHRKKNDDDCYLQEDLW